MTANRKRIGITAPDGAWKLLGELLAAQRRVGLGYRSKVRFAADRLPPTPSGNANVRLVSDIENSYRPDTWPAETLRELAQAYQVGYESVLAVLRGQAAELAPPPPARVEVLPSAPASELLREDAVRPYAAVIWERLLDLAGRGVRDPSGAELGLPPDDAKVWDGAAGAMSQSDRAWLTGDIQRRRAVGKARSRAGAAGA